MLPNGLSCEGHNVSQHNRDIDGDEEMAQWLRMLAALPEDPGSQQSITLGPEDLTPSQPLLA